MYYNLHRTRKHCRVALPNEKAYHNWCIEMIIWRNRSIMLQSGRDKASISIGAMNAGCQTPKTNHFHSKYIQTLYRLFVDRLRAFDIKRHSIKMMIEMFPP